MTSKERRIVDAAVAFIVWANKVPSPPNYSEEYDRRQEELFAAVSDSFEPDQWWAETWAPDGWPVEAR